MGPATALLLACALQRGDVAGEPQPDLPAELAAPLSPPRTPAEELSTFVAADGLRVELVAAEPLIEAPVQAVFDEDGRLWVVEMRAYMRDIDGRGETEPSGRVSVLHDDDGDGRMDRAVRFLDGLVLPRSVAPTRGGALVIVPPQVLYCRDTDGDGAADETTVVDTGIGGIASPEYGPNGLLPTLDNAFACAQHDLRYRFESGRWIRERVAPGGQWGIDADDAGRQYFNTNTDLLRAHLVPPHEAAANPFVDAPGLVNVGLVRDQSIRPVRPTLAINRAYRAGHLKDGRIHRADAACAVLIERGGLLPESFRGDAFVCDPVGNLVHWLELAPDGDHPSATPQPDARPLLASTDERFRPVNLASGPDGAVYVVDMYRGVVQHKNFVTTFLRKQTLARALEQPLDRGRIWRVAPAGARRTPVPKLSKLSSAELLPYLGHANAWLRQTAQRLLVEDDWDESVVLPRLREAARGSGDSRTRTHALWALHGRDALDDATLERLLIDRDPAVRLQALRAATGRARLSTGALALIAGPPRLESDAGRALLRQSIAALALRREAASDALALGLLARASDRADLRHAALLGAAGRGIEVLGTFLDVAPALPWAGGGRDPFLRDLATAIVREGRDDAIAGLVSAACSTRARDAAAAVPLLEGALAARGKSSRRLRATSEPHGLRGAAEASDAALAKAARALLDALSWPGRADVPAEEQVAPLAGDDLARFERGRAIYASVCAACHQPSGLGLPGTAPPLRDSEFALGDATRAAAIVLAGLSGPIEVAGRSWDLEMPAWNASDDEIAAVLTYVRREWGHAASPVAPADVARARARVIDRAKQRAGPLRAADLAQWGSAAPIPGWRAIGDALWSVEDGAIRGRVGGGKQSFLATERSYGDFVLEVDVKLLGKGNSGIQVRSHQRENGQVFGYQIEIDPSERAWSGGLYDEARRGWLQDLSKNDAGRAAFRRDDWNHYRIECEGTRIRAWVNGIATADWVDPLDVEGFIALQVHSGEDTDVLWRDLKVVDRGQVEVLTPRR